MTHARFPGDGRFPGDLGTTFPGQPLPAAPIERHRGSVLSFPTGVVMPGEVHEAVIHVSSVTRLVRFYCEPPSESLVVTSLQVGREDFVMTSSGLAGIGIARLRDEQDKRMSWPTLLPGQAIRLRVRSLWKKRTTWLVAGFWIVSPEP